MRTKYKNKFQEIIINNRWKMKYYSRSSDWVIVGFSRKWFSPHEFEYIISLFGIDIRFWFERKIKKGK